MAGNPIAASLDVLRIAPSMSLDGSERRKPSLASSWSRLVVMFQGASGKGRLSAESDESPHPLASPQECAEAHLEEVEQALGKVPRGTNQAALLKKLAAWWIASFGDELDPDWDGSVDHWRESLRSVRGVNHETADRILLLVAGKPAWPVSRASMRIACRHGWMDPGAEYEEWQSIFVRGCEADVDAMTGLSSAYDEIGRTHCGVRPKCEGCSLESLLPSGGPREAFD
jgi:endonuclease-3 related protein